MTHAADRDREFMGRALQLARRGLGRVEPNPPVGCLIVRDGEVVGEGWHQQFGGPHAEVEALRNAGPDTRGATLYVSLEPCCHHGKTPPCTVAVLTAGIARVVVGTRDPFPEVAGQGLATLRRAGLDVVEGVLADEAAELIAPFTKLVCNRRPWVVAKWAETLDGHVATATGDSRWISNSASRAIVHQLRGRVDGILVGRGTVMEDDPLLTARPAGPRQAVRIVLDTRARISPDCQLVRTARETPVLIATGPDADASRCRALEAAGCEVLALAGDSALDRLAALLDELGRRRWTHLLVEGGSQVLGSFLDLREIDEVHAFVAPCLIGGHQAPAAIGGQGRQRIGQALRLTGVHIQNLDGDAYVTGRVDKTPGVR